MKQIKNPIQEGIIQQDLEDLGREGYGKCAHLFCVQSCQQSLSLHPLATAAKLLVPLLRLASFHGYVTGGSWFMFAHGAKTKT